MSCLEIHLAIICASIPVFWPVIQKSLFGITVSYEVQIIEDRVNDFGLSYELEHAKLGKRSSTKSFSGTSTEGLTQEGDVIELQGQSPIGVDPFDTRGPQVNIKSQPTPKPKWEI